VQRDKGVLPAVVFEGVVIDAKRQGGHAHTHTPRTLHRKRMEAPPPQHQGEGKEGQQQQPPHLMVAIEVDRKVRRPHQ